MSCYRGPHFKKIHRLGDLPGQTNKKPRAGSDLRNQLHFAKKSQYYIRLEEKQIAFSLWSYRMTITKIRSYHQKSQGVSRSSFTTIKYKGIVPLFLTNNSGINGTESKRTKTINKPIQ